MDDYFEPGMPVHPGAVIIDHRAICETMNVWIWNNLDVDHPVRIKWNSIWMNPPLRAKVHAVNTTNPNQLG